MYCVKFCCLSGARVLAPHAFLKNPFSKTLSQNMHVVQGPLAPLRQPLLCWPRKRLPQSLAGAKGWYLFGGKQGISRVCLDWPLACPYTSSPCIVTISCKLCPQVLSPS